MNTLGTNALRLLSIVSIGLVGWLATAAVASAGLSGAWPQTVAASAEYAWIRAALVDFSLMTGFVSLWILGREDSRSLGFLYVVALWIFGAAFLGAYVLWHVQENCNWRRQFQLRHVARRAPRSPRRLLSRNLVALREGRPLEGVVDKQVGF